MTNSLTWLLAKTVKKRLFGLFLADSLLVAVPNG
jgi:hypothetical protein